MSVTAHRSNHTFHVDYESVTFGKRPLKDFLYTNTGFLITTETLLPIEIEFTGDTILLGAHKTGHNRFTAIQEN